MFEDFSFSSPSTRLSSADHDRVMVDCDSSLISPLSSRCPSPKSFYRFSSRPSMTRSRSSFLRSPQPPTSAPFNHHQKRLSISALTRKLHEHTLDNPESTTDDCNRLSPTAPLYPSVASKQDAGVDSASFPGYFVTPPDTDQDDEGLCDSSSVSSSQPSAPQSPFFNHPTSMPLECPPLLSNGRCRDLSFDSPMIYHQDKEAVRVRRQQISRLQCGADTAVDAVRHALEEEMQEQQQDPDSFLDGVEYHPSSLPQQLSFSRRRTTTTGRQSSRTRSPREAATNKLNTFHNSINNELSVPDSFESCRRKSSTSTNRIDKSYNSRDSRKRSGRGLRRKSLVSAALASMADRRSHSPA